MTSVQKEKIVVIGNGMVSCHFCTEFVKEGLAEKFALTVYGDEPRPAYDRVRLTSYADHRDLKKIELKSLPWYKENGIELNTGEKISYIDKENKTVTTLKGNSVKYDYLILATGSSPFIPPIPGSDTPGVFTYRTYEDVDKIIDFCASSRVAVVAGGGLLGLEAADFFKRMGLQTHIVELADYLLPRQLDLKGAEIFKSRIGKKGFKVHTGESIEKISKNYDGSLKIILRSGKEINADVTIISAGIRSNSDLAKEAGIKCSSAKGVIIDNHLQTSEENIFAIGECARHRGILYGLAAPGYKMAEVLIDRLNGGTEEFYGADMSTRLKMLGEDVISLGDALQPERSYEFCKDEAYRKLVYSDQGGLIGAIGVGEWPEAGQIQAAITNNMPLSKNEIDRFKKSGCLWDEQTDVTKWPDNTVICNCMSISKGSIVDALNSGCCTVADIAEKTGASTICGSCDPLLQQFCGTTTIERRKKPEKVLLAVSFLTLISAIAVITIPTLWGGSSIDDGKFKFTQTFSSSLFRQISGFTLLFLTLCASSISLRKRWKIIRFGSFKTWRIIHGIIGLVSLIVLTFHTGLSAGRNLNLALFTLFTAINILGFLTGVAASFEFFGLSRISAFCRRWRRQITFFHILAFWPLPLLITFHIIQAYYF